MRRKTFHLPLLSLLAWTALCTTALAQSPDIKRWDKSERKCISLFSEPDKAEPAKLETCADEFNTDARLHLLSGLAKDDAKKAMHYLYEKGTDRAALIARDGLYRFGVKIAVRPERGQEAPSTAAAPVARVKYRPDLASKGDQNKALALAKKGVKDLSKNRNDRAEKTLTEAVQLDGRCEFCIYNLACATAKQGQGPPTYERLQWLSDLGTEDAIERLIKARTDGDFAKVNKDPEFKRITGYARIRVVNTLGEPGEKAMENIEIMLKEMGHERPDTADSKDKRDAPQVLFKPHAKAQTAVISSLLNHPRVRIDPMTEDSPYDIIILWGALTKQEGGSTMVESMGPKTVDGKMSEARSAQNKVLAKPEAAINKVDRVISTPERTYKSVEAMGKRVEGTFNKGKGVFEKVGGMGEKINSL